MRENLALAADICIIFFAISVFLKGWASGRRKATQKNPDVLDIPPGHKFTDSNKDVH